MKLQQKLIGAKFIADQMGKSHEWGKTDCCTVFLQYHDALWGTNKADPVVEKYHGRRGAINFYKNMKLSWRQWLFMNGYEEKTSKPREGDIAVLDHSLFPTVYIFHNDVFWTMSEDRNFIGVDATVLTKHDNVSVWRHK